MAISPGSRQALSMAVGWLAVCGSTAAGIVYFAEIKAAARGLLGIQGPAVSQAMSAEGAAREAGPRRPARSGNVAEIRAGAHGHYYARSEINGRPVNVLVDTGASLVALTFDDARLAGVFVRDRDFTQYVSTANGMARVAPVTLDRVSISDITVRNVPAIVSEPGKLNRTLLGMSFLNRLRRVDMREGVLVLQE